jgi:glycosyltransferase involved in cell wall biosynthesis
MLLSDSARQSAGGESQQDSAGWTRRRVALSVVVPCYNEEAVLAELQRRLRIVCDEQVRGAYEVILVNDGSTDRTWQAIKTVAAADEHFVGVNLARNYGHQLALSAGLGLCRGDRILVIDADLQDPPELLGEMMALMNAGANVVYGQRQTREGENVVKRMTAAVFYKLMGKLTDVRIPIDTGDFRLLDRKVLNVLNAMPEQYRYVRGMVAWVGLTQVALPYKRLPRFAGSTKYPLAKMMTFALDAITGFSIRPLRITFAIAMLFLILAVFVAAYVLYSWWVQDTVRGWTSTLLLFLLFGTAQLVCIGIIGEYVGRIFMQSKQRPLYVIDEIYTSQP